MTIETWLLFVGTVLLLMSTPGPSHLLMLSTSMANGFQRSLATAAGDLCANALQITLSGLGLAVIVTQSKTAFSIIKWAGVAYLIWLGVKLILSSLANQASEHVQKPASLKRLWLTGFVTSAANPKAVVFFAALFPQFLNPNSPVVPQIVTLGLTYLVIDACFLLLYGKSASLIADRLRGRHRAMINRLAGVSLVGAAVALGFKTNTSS